MLPSEFDMVTDEGLNQTRDKVLQGMARRPEPNPKHDEQEGKSVGDLERPVMLVLHVEEDADEDGQNREGSETLKQIPSVTA
jgi:hypothetical protein